MRKYFVVDTNVLLHSARSLFAFGDNVIVIPIQVLEELDNFKSRNDELGRNAREVVRTLDSLRAQGSLREGVPLNGTGGVLQVDLMTQVPGGVGLDSDTPDNRILGSAWRLQLENKPVIFVTKDINLRIKSDAIGITTQDFENEKVSLERIDDGWHTLEVGDEDITTLRETGGLTIPIEIAPNEYVLLKNRDHGRQTVIARRDREAPDVVRSLPDRREPVFGIKPRNLEQHMALDLLLDDSVSLVTLVGKAGTGKTLLALAAGLHKT
ncbi:MAG: PhoH family protein, partial [Planctomycetota bacterium]